MLLVCRSAQRRRKTGSSCSGLECVCRTGSSAAAETSNTFWPDDSEQHADGTAPPHSPPPLISVPSECLSLPPYDLSEVPVPALLNRAQAAFKGASAVSTEPAAGTRGSSASPSGTSHLPQPARLQPPGLRRCSLRGSVLNASPVRSHHRLSLCPDVGAACVSPRRNGVSSELVHGHRAGRSLSRGGAGVGSTGHGYNRPGVKVGEPALGREASDPPGPPVALLAACSVQPNSKAFADSPAHGGR